MKAAAEAIQKVIEEEKEVVKPVVVKKLGKAACKEAGRRFSSKRGCTKRCRSKLLTFDKDTARCTPIEAVVEAIEEKVEEVLDEKCGDGKIFDKEKKDCVAVTPEEAPKFPDIDFDKKECSKAGLRFSKKRNSCYTRCKKSSSKVFDQD